MLHKQNLHTHTTYVDGKDTPEEMVLAAMAKGFTSIGFSEHSFNPFSPISSKMTPEATARYKAEIRSLKEKYRGRLEIFCGLECEFFVDLPTDGYDYLIGSVHYLKFGDRYYSFDRGLPETLAYIREHFDGDSLRFAKAYYGEVARLSEKPCYDIIGHFDLITKNNELSRFLDTGCKAYLDAGMEAIHALKGKIPFFEVNTGAVARGYRTAPYPQMDFLREFGKCGFGPVITCDCHDSALLGKGFDQARELLLEAGFRSQWILTEEGFREVSL